MDIYIKSEQDISLQEWLDYVKTDKELVLAEHGEGIHPITKQKLRIEIPGRVLFENHEIVYKKGCIGCEDCSEEVLVKLKEIAEVFHAEVLE